jgi:hypothetical protein
MTGDDNLANTILGKTVKISSLKTNLRSGVGNIRSWRRPAALFGLEKTLWDSSDLIEFGPLLVACMPRQQDGE